MTTRYRAPVFWICGRPFSVLVSTVLYLALSLPAQQVSLKDGKSLIDPRDLPLPMAAMLGALGDRMTTAEKAQIAIAGNITDSNGTRAAQIVVQSPGLFSYRDGQGRAITFNGGPFKTKAGSLGAEDERILESLLAHFPDAVMLQLATGGAWRRVGSHFRTDSGKTANYVGPYWTVYAFSPADRPGLARGTALQQEIFIAIDEKTGRLSEIRTAAVSGPKQTTVTQTQFSNWVQQGGQWVPGQIVRVENGKQVLSFQVQKVAVGPSSAVAAFEP